MIGNDCVLAALILETVKGSESLVGLPGITGIYICVTNSASYIRFTSLLSASSVTRWTWRRKHVLH